MAVRSLPTPTRNRAETGEDFHGLPSSSPLRKSLPAQRHMSWPEDDPRPPAARLSLQSTPGRRESPLGEDRRRPNSAPLGEPSTMPFAARRQIFEAPDTPPMPDSDFAQIDLDQEHEIEEHEGGYQMQPEQQQQQQPQSACSDSFSTISDSQEAPTPNDGLHRRQTASSRDDGLEAAQVTPARQEPLSLQLGMVPMAEAELVRRFSVLQEREAALESREAFSSRLFETVASTAEAGVQAREEALRHREEVAASLVATSVSKVQALEGTMKRRTRVLLVVEALFFIIALVSGCAFGAFYSGSLAAPASDSGVCAPVEPAVEAPVEPPSEDNAYLNWAFGLMGCMGILRKGFF